MRIDASPRRRIARALERGANLPGLGTLAAVWGALAPIARPVDLPPGLRAVTIGGATLGGSGKTPLAIACARFLSGEGASVAFVGHAYGARVSVARVVAPGDAAAGDEAAEAASALASVGVPVVVGPSRQEAVDFAARLASVVVLDGPLALTPPARARTLALLAVDGAAPFGSGACPPSGDLRADPARLVAAADAVVCVGDSSNLGVAHHRAPRVGLRVRERGVDGDEPLAAWAARAGDDGVNVATAIARPERFLRTLTDAGVRIRRHLEAADHADLVLPPGAWLVPRKNAARARAPSGGFGFASANRGRGHGNRLAWVEYDIDLPAGLRELLCARLLGPG